jgi:hypothetical protein
VIACGGGIGRALDARVVIHASRSLPENRVQGRQPSQAEYWQG